MDALSYRLQRALIGKKMPKPPSLQTSRISTPVFTGRPTGSIEDVDTPIEGGLAGALTQTSSSPFSSLMLFKRRMR